MPDNTVPVEPEWIQTQFDLMSRGILDNHMEVMGVSPDRPGSEHPLVAALRSAHHQAETDLLNALQIANNRADFYKERETDAVRRMNRLWQALNYLAGEYSLADVESPIDRQVLQEALALCPGLQ